jgi:hypothetical protein
MSFYRTHTLTCTPSYTLTCTPSKLTHYGAASQGLFLTSSISVWPYRKWGGTRDEWYGVCTDTRWGVTDLASKNLSIRMKQVLNFMRQLRVIHLIIRFL